MYFFIQFVKVRCVQDYIRPASQRRDGKGPVSEKDFWSVYLIEGNQNVNVALDLISQGYATLVPLKYIFHSSITLYHTITHFLEFLFCAE